ncbi:MAG TPA: substrate-binding domain-containing protein [Steroidobacteraceae bacterium]
MERSSRAGSLRSTSKLLAAALFAAAGFAASVCVANEQQELRVCADPNNLPQSNKEGEGFENKIAEALARDLGRTLKYTFFPQRMGFVRNTLRARDETDQHYKCDVIIGVPKGYELTATTRPYMHSTYALVFRETPELSSVKTPDDLLKLPALRKLRIGAFAGSPGADWLQMNGLLAQAQFYPQQSGDPAEHPASIIGRDLAAGNIDVAIVWGPVAGFLVDHHSGDDKWVTVPFQPHPKVKFNYEIAMGVRFGEKDWRDTLDQWIATHQSEIDQILKSYGVPLLPLTTQTAKADDDD